MNPRLIDTQGKDPRYVKRKGFATMNKFARIHVCPIKRFCSVVESLKREANVAVILCSIYPIPIDKFDGVPHIHLSFSDVTNPMRLDAFRTEMAQEIKSFVDNLEDTNILAICCDSGESRSSAIAAAILRYLGRNEMDICGNPSMHPNPQVYHLQCKAFGCFSTKLRTELLCRYNKRLFKKQIQRSKK